MAINKLDTGAIQDNAITNAKMADDAVGVADLAATGTPSSTTFLRGDNAWATAGSTSASDLTSGTLPIARIADGAVTAAKVAADVATQAELDTVSTVASAALPKAGGTMTGNVTHSSGYLDMAGGHVYLADNAKALFGTSEDLHIYHENTNNHSYIWEKGSGDLYLRGTDIRIKSNTDNDDMATFIENGAASLFYSNAKKIETTATGIDVSGIAVTDGITSSGNITFDNGNSSVSIKSDGANGSYIQFGSNEYLRFLYDNGASESIRLIDGGGITFNGDTAAANALDDYEEGATAVGSIVVKDGSTTLTCGTGAGLKYTKIGNTVRVQFEFRVTNLNGAGGGSNFKMGLPFTNVAGGYATGINRIYNGNVAGGEFIAVGSEDAFVEFRRNVNGSPTVSQTAATNAYYFGTIVYQTN